MRRFLIGAGMAVISAVACAEPRIVRFGERCLTAEPTVVAKGARLDAVAVLEAEMGGSWVPGGPYPCRPERVVRDAERGTLVCQLQSRSPKDGVMRVVGLELAQAGDDITARLRWARYRYQSDAATYGADFEDQKVRSGACAIAGDYAQPGYGIGQLVLGLDGATLLRAEDEPTARIAAPAELLQGVRSVNVGGGAIPGPFVLLSTNAFPLVEAAVGSGARAPIAVGATYGRGRAVAFGHPGFLQQSNCLGDGRRLVAQALAWTAGAASSATRVAVLREKSVAQFLRALGCTEVQVVKEVPAPGAADLLVATGFEARDVEPTLALVEAGGGLLGTTLGWGYLYFHRDAVFTTDFADNRVYGRFGFVQAPVMAKRIDDGFPAVVDAATEGMRGDRALALALSPDWPRLALALRRQVGATLSLLVAALPDGTAPAIERQTAALVRLRGGEQTPTVERPVTESDALARFAIMARQIAWQRNPELPVDADPSAAVYPGLVAPGTPETVREVPVDPSVPRWHSTGVFAPAGRPLTVTLPEGAERLGLRVRIGSTADDLTGLADWRRAPLVTVEHPLSKRETTIYSPFGGLVYVVCADNRPASQPLAVRIAGGVAAPWFKLGRDSTEDFAAACATSGAPYGEIEGEHFVVTAETAGLRRVKDPAWIARYWDAVVAADRELAGLTMRRYQERICSDVQLTCGWMHSGYPLMTHQNEAHLDWAIDEARLAKGEGWGCYHEIGHNHQDRVWTPACCGEVTVNLFTVLAIERVAGQDWREERFESGRNRMAARVKAWKSGGATYEAWKKDPFLQLELYLRLQEAFGWEAYRETIGRYWRPGFARPNVRDDVDIFNVFVRTMSDVTKTDLAAVFAAWSIPMSDRTKRHCAAYPAPAAALLP